MIDTTRKRQEADLAAAPEPADPGSDPSLAAAEVEVRAHLQESLRKVAEGLTEREFLALMLKYQQHMPQRSIAQAMGVSDSRVTRLVAHGFEKWIRESDQRHA